MEESACCSLSSILRPGRMQGGRRGWMEGLRGDDKGPGHKGLTANGLKLGVRHSLHGPVSQPNPSSFPDTRLCGGPGEEESVILAALDHGFTASPCHYRLLPFQGYETRFRVKQCDVCGRATGMIQLVVPGAAWLPSPSGPASATASCCLFELPTTGRKRRR